MKLIVDTGAGTTCLDAGHLPHVGLQLSRHSRKDGGVGSSTMKLTTIGDHDLSLAGLDLSSFKLVALDLSHVNDGLRRAKVAPIAGVLGADVLIRHCAVMDYARSCIVFARRSRRATNEA